MIFQSALEWQKKKKNWTITFDEKSILYHKNETFWTVLGPIHFPNSKSIKNKKQTLFWYDGRQLVSSTTYFWKLVNQQRWDIVKKSLKYSYTRNSTSSKQ